MPICYLHVGTKKTGTTAIQGFLRDRREVLRERGILVPSTGQARNGYHGPLVRHLVGDPGAPTAVGDAHGKLDAELAANPEHSVVISCEALEQFFRVGQPCTIVPFFQSRGYDVKLICFVRPQPERINSAYVQNIKTFVRDWEVPDFVKTLHKSLFYTRWFTIAREHDAELITLPYDRAARKEGVVGRFLRLFSAEDLAPSTDEYRANLTIGRAGVAAGRTSLQRLGRLGLTLDQRQRTRAAEALREADEAAPSEPFYGLPPALVEQIEACYHDDNELFASSRWGVAWRDVFEPVAPPSYNELKSREERSRSPEYTRIIEEVWPKVRRIAKEPSRA